MQESWGPTKDVIMLRYGKFKTEFFWSLSFKVLTVLFKLVSASYCTAGVLFLKVCSVYS